MPSSGSLWSASSTGSSDVFTPCGVGEVQSRFGCAAISDEDNVFINSSQLLWVNSGAQLIIVLVGVLDFFVGTLYFCIRRRRNEERLERSRAARQSLRINEDGRTFDPPRKGMFARSSASHPPLKPVSELNGRCCGCGNIADTVLLPCKHAVCCYSCSDHATSCPFCKETCTDRQRLFAV